MRSWWGERNAFAPEISDAIGQWTWYPQWLERLAWVGIGQDGRLGSVANGGPQVLAIGTAVVIGVLSIVTISQRAELRWLLTGPLLIAFALSQLRIYPTSGRLSLYLVPVVLLFAAAGADTLLSRLSRYPSGTAKDHTRLAGGAIAFTLVSLLVIQATHTVPGALSPLNDKDMRGVLAEVAERQRSGDVVIFERWSRPMQWYVTPELAASLEIVVLDAQRVASDGLPTDLDLRTRERLWVTSTHRAGLAAQLSRQIATEEPFVILCEWTPEPDTYLALLVREDLQSQADPNETCPPQR